MTLTAVVFQYVTIRRIASGKSKKVLAIQHVRTIELEVPFDDAFDACLSSLRQIKKCRTPKGDRSLGKIRG